MHKEITLKERKELERVLDAGQYLSPIGTKRTRMEYLALAFLKYLIYGNITSWRQGFTNHLKDCPMNRGERAKAVGYLKIAGIIRYDGRRRYCPKSDVLLNHMQALEKELFGG